MSEQTTSLPGKISCSAGTVATGDGAALAGAEADASALADAAALGVALGGAVDALGVVLALEHAATEMAAVRITALRVDRRIGWSSSSSLVGSRRERTTSFAGRTGRR